MFRRFRRLFVLTALLAAIPAVSARAETAHDLAMSYILADQDKPTKAGDKLYLGEDDNPVLMETTGYCHGTKGSHGDRMRTGYCAGAPDMYGSVVMCYEAIEQPDGSFDIGDYLETFEIKDTGFGYPTNKGSSTIRPDKKSAGTIETGVHIDVYHPDISGCREWMERTNGKIFAVVIKGKG